MEYELFLGVWYHNKKEALDILRVATPREFERYIGGWNVVGVLGEDNKTHFSVYGCGDNIFHHIARIGDTVLAKELSVIAKQKNVEYDRLLTQCDISGMSPIAIAILNIRFDTAKILLESVKQIDFYVIVPTKITFHYNRNNQDDHYQKIEVTRKHPLDSVFCVYHLVADSHNHVIHDIISDIISKFAWHVESNLFQVPNLLSEAVRFEIPGIFKAVANNTKFTWIFRVVNSLVYCKKLNLLETFLEIFREKNNGQLVYAPDRHLFSLEDTIKRLLESNCEEHLTIFLRHYDIRKNFEDEPGKDPIDFLEGCLNIHSGIVHFSVLLKHFLTMKLVNFRENGITSYSNRLLLRLVMTFCRYVKCYRTMEEDFLKDRIETLYVLLDAGIDRVNSIEFLENERISQNNKFIDQFADAYKQYHKHVTLFRLLYYIA